MTRQPFGILGILAVWSCILPPSNTWSAQSLTDQQIIAVVKAHRTRDGATVVQVVTGVGRAIRLTGWWGDNDHHYGGYNYIDDPTHSPTDPYSVAWKVIADGTIVPEDEDAWIVELGRMPFAYYVNQRDADNRYGMPVDRKLLHDPAVLAFLPSGDGDLAKTFKVRRLSLRSMGIEWVVKQVADASNGRLEEGYMVTVGYDCPDHSPTEIGQDAMRFVEPGGTGGFRAFEPMAANAIAGTGPSCL